MSLAMSFSVIWSFTSPSCLLSQHDFFGLKSVKERLEDSLQAKGEPEVVSPATALTVLQKKAEMLGGHSALGH